MTYAAIQVLNPLDFELPIIASLPHSGVMIPSSVADLCTDLHLKTLRNTDWHLRELYDFLPALGVHVVQADFSRYVIDPNRNLKEPLFGKLSHRRHTRRHSTTRTARNCDYIINS